MAMIVRDSLALMTHRRYKEPAFQRNFVSGQVEMAKHLRMRRFRGPGGSRPRSRNRAPAWRPHPATPKRPAHGVTSSARRVSYASEARHVSGFVRREECMNDETVRLDRPVGPLLGLVSQR